MCYTGKIGRKKMHSKTIIERELEIMKIIERRLLMEKYKPYMFFIGYLLMIIVLVWWLI